MKSALCLFSLAVAAMAQQAASPAFEVASVKPSEPPAATAGPGGMVMRFGGGCGRPDPGFVNCTNASLKQLLIRAYGVKAYQIEGPSWMDNDKFDVRAKIPEGATPDQVNLMMQNLLAERFKVVVHKDTRQLPAYELSIAKGGPKLKEVDKKEVEEAAAKAAEAAKGGPSAAPPLPPPPPRPGAGIASMGAPPIGSMMIMMNSNGARTYRTKNTMKGLCDMLSNNLSRAVVDATGLTGTYDIELTYLADDADPMMQQMRTMMQQSGPPPAGAGVSHSGDGGPGGADAATPIATLFQAVQQQLGLKLDQKKAATEIVVVDSANRVPTEN